MRNQGRLLFEKTSEEQRDIRTEKEGKMVREEIGKLEGNQFIQGIILRGHDKIIFHLNSVREILNMDVFSGRESKSNMSSNHIYMFVYVCVCVCFYICV